MYLCCGRWCGLWTGPLKRYAEAFAAQRFLPDLYITNHMNHEAILQVNTAGRVCILIQSGCQAMVVSEVSAMQCVWVSPHMYGQLDVTQALMTLLIDVPAYV